MYILKQPLVESYEISASINNNFKKNSARRDLYLFIYFGILKII
jgi:hypothetical protein